MLRSLVPPISMLLRGGTCFAARALATSVVTPPSAAVKAGRRGGSMRRSVPNAAVQAHLAVYDVDVTKALRRNPAIASYNIERVERVTSYLSGLGVDVKRVLDVHADVLAGQVEAYEAKVQLLRDNGVNVARVISMCPMVLTRRIGTLQSILDAIASCGHPVAPVVDRNPGILRCAASSISSILQPRRHPSLAQPSSGPLEEDPRVVLLSSMGLDASQLMRRAPHVVCLRFDKMHTVVNYLTGLQLDIRKVIQRTPSVLSLRPDAMQQRVQFLTENGLDVVRIINACPSILYASVEGRLQPILAFVVHELGQSPSRLNGAGPVWCCSLEGRLRPRFLYLKSLGRPVGSIGSLVARGDRGFTKSVAKTDLLHYYAWRLRNGFAVPPGQQPLAAGSDGEGRGVTTL